MKLIFSIVAAAHAKGTHHHLALNGLKLLKASERELWQRLYLKHAVTFLSGAKAPDDEFKDFKNHVLHPRDDFWGGAPAKARSWYGHLVTAIREQDWPTAAWAAGVLSHYVTDPVHPFHTAQSEAENNIHRAVEWSISKSFPALWSLAEREIGLPSITLPAGDTWLEVAICNAASRSNAQYEKLIAHYDFTRGVVDPPSGLDLVAQRLCADLVGYAAALYSAILERAHEEAGLAPPDVALTADMLLATLKMPFAALARRMADREERRLIERMYDELKATGTVESNLPEDDRTVRDLHAAEVIARRPASDPARRFAGSAPKPVETSVERARRLQREQQERTAVASAAALAPRPQPAPPAEAAKAARRDPPPPVPIARTNPQPAAPIRLEGGARSGAAALDPVSVAPVPAAPAAVAVAKAVPPSAPIAASTAPPPPGPALSATAPHDGAAGAEPESAASRPVVEGGLEQRLAAARPPAPRRPAGPRFYLTRESDLVDAPSIGPKMAERFTSAGVHTVATFVDAEPEVLAARLGVRQVTPETIVDWQDQARLVMTVPGLRGTHAQLLVGAGFRTAAAIAAAEPDALCARVLAFAATPDGQRALRNGDPPDIARIKGWLEAAKSAAAA